MAAFERAQGAAVVAEDEEEMLLGLEEAQGAGVLAMLGGCAAGGLGVAELGV